MTAVKAAKARAGILAGIDACWNCNFRQGDFRPIEFPFLSRAITAGGPAEVTSIGGADGGRVPFFTQASR